MDKCLTKKELLDQIYQCEFTLIDINLFLDTHPCSKEALSDYECYYEQLKLLKQKYEEMYGPLSDFGASENRSDKEWLYAKQPFPWTLKED